ncbi:nucleotidyl transferase AbiEii/AbiGii toxin family protein [Promicromonospora sukumoe]
MRPFHDRLARIGLGAADRYGFVLAGGYAISANGMGDRPSVDVDLFTDRGDPEQFAEAVDAVRQAFRAEGFTVVDNRIGPTFADLRVSDEATSTWSDIQLGWDYREFPPRLLEIGPVLDPRDAVANKMGALWSRGEARDYIDIDTVVESGRFSRDDVLAMGDRIESVPLDRHMLAERFRQAGRYPASDFALYDVGSVQRIAIVERFLGWADEIDPAVVG